MPAAAATPVDALAQAGTASSDTTDGEFDQARSLSNDHPVVVNVDIDFRLGARDLPGRGLADAAAIAIGVDRREGADSLVLGGFGGERVGYYLDGVPTIARLPWGAVSTIEVFTGHVPAAYGDALSGLVSVTSARAQSRAAGGVETLTSVDAFGQRVASARVGAPLLSGRLRTFVAGEYEGWADHGPKARPVIRLKDDLLAQTLEHPQIPTEGGDVMPRLYTFTAQNFGESAARRQNDLHRGTLFAAAEWLPMETLSLSISGRLANERRDDQPFYFGLFNDRPFSRTSRNERGLHVVFTHTPSDNASVRLVGDLSDFGFITHHPSFSGDVRDVLFYGDINHSANAVAARYLRLDPYEGGLVRMYEDGAIYDVSGLGNLFAQPGALPTAYEKGQVRQAYAAAEATVNVRSHHLRLGVSGQQQARRHFRMADPYILARLYQDGQVENLEPAVSRYEDLPPWLAAGVATYYGWDALGLRKVSDDNVLAYASGLSFDVAPHKPRRYAAYVEDRVRVGPLTLDAGLRIDAFDNNTRALRDPFSLRPIVRAGDLPQRPEGMGSEYAVYFTDYVSDQVVGYRDLEGNFYDSAGDPVRWEQVRGDGVLRLVEFGLSPAIFRRSRIRSRVQPRIRAELAVLPGTALFANYDQFARYPVEHAYATVADYARSIASGGVIGNSDLKLERSTLYGLGVRQQVATARLSARVFMRTYDDLVGLYARHHTEPRSLITYENRYDATTKGLELSLTLMRTRGLSAAAGYVLQDARGSLIGDLLTPQRVFWSEGVKPDNRPLTLDRRHQIKIFAGYRMEEGLRLGGVRPFAGLNVSLFADVKSGRPYSTRERPFPLWMTEITPPTAANAGRMPWSYLVNLKIQRDFQLRGTSVGAFVWIDNLLNADNVVRVYGTTGEPDDDGFLDSEDGRSVAESQGSFEDGFRDYYRYRLANPDHYGIPRIVRVGIDVRL